MNRDTTATVSTPADALMQALEVLDRRGWHQGFYFDPTRPPTSAPVDLLGAVNQALYGSPLHPENPVQLELMGLDVCACLLLAEAAGVDRDDLDDWQDQVGRSLGEVRAAFKRAIELASRATGAAVAT